jgi:hypothetical protein
MTYTNAVPRIGSANGGEDKKKMVKSQYDKKFNNSDRKKTKLNNFVKQ